MRAGRLKHPVTIQRFISTVNDFGETIEEWSDLYTTRAEIKPISAKEIFASDRPITEMTHKITIRYREELKPTDRIKFNNRYFNITSIANYNEQNQVLEILTKEQF